MRTLTLLPLLLLSLPAAAAELLLNSSSAEDLSSVDGVDLALATRIVELRQTRGTLGSVEALRVLDIAPDTLEHLRDEVLVDLPIARVANEKGAKTYKSAGDVLEEFNYEPDIRAVQAMSMAYTKTNPELVEAWLGSARRAYALPKLQVGYQKDLKYNEGYGYKLADELDSSSELIGLLEDVDTDNDDRYVVKLEWRLDKLIMSSERIRVINEAQDIVKLRDKVLDEVTRVYFDRRRLQVEMLLNPSSDLQAQIKDELRLQELTANLDAFTGGAFSASLAR